MNIDISEYVYLHLTKMEYLIRDLQHALVLTGDKDAGVELALCRVRESIESAADLVRSV